MNHRGGCGGYGAALMSPNAPVWVCPALVSLVHPRRTGSSQQASSTVARRKRRLLRVRIVRFRTSNSVWNVVGGVEGGVLRSLPRGFARLSLQRYAVPCSNVPHARRSGAKSRLRPRAAGWGVACSALVSHCRPCLWERAAVSVQLHGPVRPQVTTEAWTTSRGRARTLTPTGLTVELFSHYHPGSPWCR